MFEKMKWEDVYQLWKNGCYYLPEMLSASLTAETVFVEYKQKGYFYGYDWLENKNAQDRKTLIERNPIEFMFFTKPSNKGTIQTAEMLLEAKNEEERAAIWIAATTKELLESRVGKGIWRYAEALHMAACEFLKDRYYLWHHAMRRLVPEIMIPWTVLDSIVCENAETVMGIIQLNTVLLKSTYSILRYSSLKDGELPECKYRIGN